MIRRILVVVFAATSALGQGVKPPIEKLSKLLDVTITSPTNNQVLTYDSALVKWKNAAGGGGGGAPTDATYITQTSNGTLSAEQALSALATGLMKNTTGTGVVSIGVAGTDFVAPNSAITGATNTKITYDAKGLVTAGASASIADFAGTKAQYDTSLSDGNFVFVGDITQYTDELAQDAIGAMIDATLEYVDATPLLRRAGLTGAIAASAGSNATTLSSFTTAQLNSALSDNDVATGGGTATGTNTGDQASIVGITGTKAQFDTAVTDGNFIYVGDVDAVLLNQIGDPSGSTLIVAGATETELRHNMDAAGVTALTVTNQDADAANDNYLLTLKHNDGADPNVFYARFLGDADGSPVNDYLFSQTAFTIGSGIATTFNAGITTLGTLELGNASDTTLSRASAGRLAVEGSNVGVASDTLSFFTASTSNTIGVGNIEVGHATDSTLSRSAAGVLSVEGNNIITANNAYGYVMDGGFNSALTPADATTYFFGYNAGINISQHATYANTSMTVPKTGTIKTVLWKVFVVTNGSAENATHAIRVNDTTDTTLGTTETYNPGANTQKTFTYTGLSTAVTTGDTINFKVVAPTWTTNPALNSGNLMVYIE